MVIQNTIAVIFDCDGTLAKDTTTFLLECNGCDSKQFWDDHKDMISKGWDPPIAWMTKILEMMQTNEIRQNTNQKLAEIGKNIELYEGVPEFILELKSIINENKFDDKGITIKFYIISSGLEDLIKGSKLKEYFDDIFAGTFNEDVRTKKINGIKSVVTFTEKTKFLYAINKGISGNELRSNPYIVNDHMKRSNRPIPFEHMIYLGDSYGDVPCFSVVTRNKGVSIGIMHKNTIEGHKLAVNHRLTVGPYHGNYKNGSDLMTILIDSINAIGYKIIDNMNRHENNDC